MSLFSPSVLYFQKTDVPSSSEYSDLTSRVQKCTAWQLEKDPPYGGEGGSRGILLASGPEFQLDFNERHSPEARAAHSALLIHKSDTLRYVTTWPRLSSTYVENYSPVPRLETLSVDNV